MVISTGSTAAAGASVAATETAAAVAAGASVTASETAALVAAGVYVAAGLAQAVKLESTKARMRRMDKNRTFFIGRTPFLEYSCFSLIFRLPKRAFHSRHDCPIGYKE